MRMHRDAAYAHRSRRVPAPRRGARHRRSSTASACEDWDEAVRLGEANGYRNAQATVLAPTGTIGLLMDCDTTGIEPDFALVKFKKLAGGGYFKIVNQTVPRALRRLGYSEREVQEIVAYVSGTNTLLAAPHINRRTLKEKGLTDAELAKVEAAIPGVFDLDSAFAAWVLGEDAYERLGATQGARGHSRGSRCSSTSASRARRSRRRSDVIVGRMTIEGAPHLREEHYAVFDCANRCGKHGQRFLAPMSHVRMMGAVQPFLSGAISKTVNLPSDSTVEDVQTIYEEGWRLGLKAVALYRDGCKASQPLSASRRGQEGQEGRDAEAQHADARPAAHAHAARARPTAHAAAHAPHDAEHAHLRRSASGCRRSARGFTQEARVGGHKIFLRTGEYEDGRLGEIFIDMHKEGAAFRRLMNCFAMSVSIGLQYGVPLQTYVDQFTFTRFEPQGPVEGHPNVKFATSIVDFIFRALGVEYLHRYDLAHIKPEVDSSPLDAARNLGTPPEPPSLRAAAAGDAGARHDAASPHARGDGAERGDERDARRGHGGSPLDAQLDTMMGDAPVCDVCGHITVRNGACYKCLNCGNSMGCS